MHLYVTQRLLIDLLRGMADLIVFINLILISTVVLAVLLPLLPLPRIVSCKGSRPKMRGHRRNTALALLHFLHMHRHLSRRIERCPRWQSEMQNACLQ